jgi:hypothetical protein
MFGGGKCELDLEGGFGIGLKSCVDVAQQYCT